MQIKKGIFFITGIFLLCIFLPALNSGAQSLDSLEKVLQTSEVQLNEQLKLYDDLSWGYLNSNVAKSVEYGKKGLNLAGRIKDANMQAVFQRNLGVAYYMASAYDSADIYLTRALSGAKKLKDKPLEARIYTALGNLHNQTSDYPGALDFYFKSLAMFEKEGDLDRVAGLYHNIGALYQRLTNIDQATVYFNKSISLAKKTGNLESEAFTLMALSNLYMDNDYQKAINLASQSADIFHETENVYNEIMAILTISQSHYRAANYKESTKYANQGLEMALKTDYPKLVAEAEGVLSNIHYHLGNYADSEMYALKALEKDSSDVNLTVNLLANILRSNLHLGNPEKAILYLDKYRDWMETYANSSYQSSLSEMEVKYESEKKELKIDALEKEKRLYTWLGITVAALLISALAFFILRHRFAVNKRKLIEQQLRQMEQEKQLIAVQAALDGEAAERSRLARDLHDGLGSMLSVVKFSLPTMKSGARIEADDVLRFKKALGMLDDSIQELRRVAHHMMPESLLRFGLKVSLTDFCEAIPNVNFHYFGNEDRLPEKLEIMIYRSIHELINNAMKHAQANHINVQLLQENDRVSFTVQDDGAGFNSEIVQEGMGLKNIQKRVETFNGKMNIYSSGKGTEINVELELKS